MWETKKLGDVCTLINGRAYKNPELLERGKYPVLRVGNFFTNKNWYYSDLELEESKYCDDGDLLYAWSASFGPRIWHGGKVIFHYHIWRIDIDPEKVFKKFLFYWFEWDAEKIKSDQGAGTTMIHVTKRSMENRLLLLPPLPEQKRIADFLDERTAWVDGLIAKKQRLLELLAEKRQALITRAVTKGLNPDTPMKPSGIDWLGNIPAHWEAKRLRFNCTSNPKKSEISETPATYVSFIPMEAVGELGGLNLERIRTLDEVYEGYTYLADGDVCVAKITPCFENGKGALASSLKNGIGFGTTELHVLRAKTNISARFLFYLSISQLFRVRGTAEMLGAGGQKRVPEDFIKDWPLVSPPLDQQESIADFLDERTKRLDKTVAKVKASIGRLQEYRAALITAAVTGKMEVT